MSIVQSAEYGKIEETPAYYILHKQTNATPFVLLPYSENVKIEWGIFPDNPQFYIRRIFYLRPKYTRSQVEEIAKETQECPHCRIGDRIISYEQIKATNILKREKWNVDQTLTFENIEEPKMAEAFNKINSDILNFMTGLNSVTPLEANLGNILSGIWNELIDCADPDLIPLLKTAIGGLGAIGINQGLKRIIPVGHDVMNVVAYSGMPLFATGLVGLTRQLIQYLGNLSVVDIPGKLQHIGQELMRQDFAGAIKMLFPKLNLPMGGIGISTGLGGKMPSFLLPMQLPVRDITTFAKPGQVIEPLRKSVIRVKNETA